MNRLLAALTLAIAATTVFAVDKVTYPTAELEVSGKNNVNDIVAQFVEDTDRAEPVEPDQLMFLIDGRAVSELAPHLPDADRVEVMSDGAYVVVNVVTHPEDEG